MSDTWQDSQLQHTDTGLTSPSIYQLRPGTWQGNHWVLLSNTGEPVFNTGEPIFNTGEPGFHTREPGFKIGEPVFNTGEPGSNTGVPGFNTGVPVFTLENQFSTL